MERENDDMHDVLFVADLVKLLGITPAAVRKMILRGDLGPYSRLGHRLLVRRESFLEALRATEIDPKARPRPQAAPKGKQKYIDMLRRPGRKGRGHGGGDHRDRLPSVIRHEPGLGRTLSFEIPEKWSKAGEPILIVNYTG